MAVVSLTDNLILVYRLARLRGVNPFEQNIQAHIVCAPEIPRAHFLGKAVRKETLGFGFRCRSQEAEFFRLDKTQSMRRFRMGGGVPDPCVQPVFGHLPASVQKVFIVRKILRIP